MNNGTRIRTALGVAIALYTALYKVDVTDFGNNTVNLIYQILMKAVTFVVIFLVTYYNNDYTEAACIGTGVTRQLKAEKGDSYIGDYFFTEEDEPLDDLEEGEEYEFDDMETDGQQMGE